MTAIPEIVKALQATPVVAVNVPTQGMMEDTELQLVKEFITVPRKRSTVPPTVVYTFDMASLLRRWAVTVEEVDGRKVAQLDSVRDDWNKTGGHHLTNLYYFITTWKNPEATQNKAVFILRGLSAFWEGGFDNLEMAQKLKTQILDLVHRLCDTKIKVILLDTQGKLTPQMSAVIPEIRLGLPDVNDLRAAIEFQVSVCASNPDPRYARLAAGLDLDALAPLAKGLTCHQAQIQVSMAFLNAAEGGLPLQEVLAIGLKDAGLVDLERHGLHVLETPDHPIIGFDRYRDWLEDVKAFNSPDYQGVAPRWNTWFFAGYPGTGKTITACHTASILGVRGLAWPFRVFGSLLGETEKNVAATLAKIESLAPCLVFIDEIDKVFLSLAAEGGAGTSQRVAAMLLKWLEQKPKDVYTVFAANNIQALYQVMGEMFRPGRVARAWFVGLPDETARLALFLQALTHYNVCVREEDLRLVIGRTEGFSGADIWRCVEDCLSPRHPVDSARLMQAASQMKTLGQSQDYSALLDWAAKNAQPV